MGPQPFAAGRSTDSLYTIQDGVLKAPPETREEIPHRLKPDTGAMLDFYFADPPKPIFTATAANAARPNDLRDRLHDVSRAPTSLYAFWLYLAPLRPTVP